MPATHDGFSYMEPIAVKKTLHRKVHLRLYCFARFSLKDKDLKTLASGEAAMPLVYQKAITWLQERIGM